MKPRVIIAAVAAAAALGAGAVWAATSPFPDVPEDHPRAEAIRYAKDEGLFLGFPDGNLRPDDELTEGQFIRTAERLYERREAWTRADWAQVLFSGLPSLAAPSAASGGGPAPFPDVPGDHPRAEAIRYAKDEGLFLGYPDGTLRPDTELSGGQFTKTAERLYARYDVWTRADWAQVLFGGLPSLAPAATTTTTAALVTSAAPIVNPPAPPPRRPSPPPATAAPTTTAAPEPQWRRARYVRWALSNDRGVFVVHWWINRWEWESAELVNGWDNGWENARWRWRILSPDAECFAQGGVQAWGEIDDVVYSFGPWSSWIVGRNYWYSVGGVECPTSSYQVEIEWESGVYLQADGCTVEPRSVADAVVDPALEPFSYGFRDDETVWKCFRRESFDYKVEEQAADEPLRRRIIFKPVPERLGYADAIDAPEPDEENWRPWCTGSYPELTLVAVRWKEYEVGEPYSLRRGLTLHPCWDAAGNEYKPFGTPDTMTSRVRRVYFGNGYLGSSGWTGKALGADTNWAGFNPVGHTALQSDYYVWRTWIIARTPEGELSRTLRVDTYSDDTWGFVECDHLVLC